MPGKNLQFGAVTCDRSVTPKGGSIYLVPETPRQILGLVKTHEKY